MAIQRYLVPYSELVASSTLATNNAVVVKFVDHLKDREAYAKQKVEEAIEAELSRIVDKKFPLGERAWCIQCAKRIKKAILSQLKESK